jgi:MoxR-like ATPase
MITRADLSGGGFRHHGSLFERLGVIGTEDIEAVVLAALALQVPMLLIGSRGSAKTTLLVRICMALDLTWRLYDASTVSYDDFVGYVRLDGDRVVFAETPSSIWPAQVVIIDEVSRARPDMQNKLFSVIWDCRVLGIKLPELRYRLSAMNTVSNGDFDADDEGYIGNYPLDAAFADRYAFLVPFPEWSALSWSDRLAVIQGEERPICPDAAAELTRRLEAIRRQLSLLKKRIGGFVAEYLCLLFDLIENLGLKMSGRRGQLLYRGALAVHAARLLVEPDAELDESLWQTVVNGLPQRAEGRPVDEGRLLLAHREAFKAAGLDEDDTRRRLIIEPDPVTRLIKAVWTKGLTVEEMTGFVADGLAEAPLGARHALADFVIRSPGAGWLAAAVAEDVAALHGMSVVAQRLEMPMRPGGPTHDVWQEVAETATRLDLTVPEDAMAVNLLFGLYRAKKFDSPGAVSKTLESWRNVRRRCRLLHRDRRRAS